MKHEIYHPVSFSFFAPSAFVVYIDFTFIAMQAPIFNYWKSVTQAKLLLTSLLLLFLVINGFFLKTFSTHYKTPKMCAVCRSFCNKWELYFIRSRMSIAQNWTIISKHEFIYLRLIMGDASYSRAFTDRLFAFALWCDHFPFDEQMHLLTFLKCPISILTRFKSTAFSHHLSTMQFNFHLLLNGFIEICSINWKYYFH